MIYHFLNSPSLYPSPFSSPATISVNQRQESNASSLWDRHRTERLHNRGILSDGARSHCGTLQPVRAFLGDRVERRVSCHSTSDYLNTVLHWVPVIKIRILIFPVDRFSLKNLHLFVLPSRRNQTVYQLPENLRHRVLEKVLCPSIPVRDDTAAFGR
jgi:hypothetical protein